MSFPLPPWAKSVQTPAPDGWVRWGLGARLAALADGVSRGARVVDIGTDHALLPEALVAAERAARVIGIDRAWDALKAARRRLDRSPFCVELRHGEGFLPLNPGEADTAVLAGFGAKKMIQALESVDLASLGIERLILQPTSGLPGLRRWLTERGFRLVRETIVREGSRGFITTWADLGGPRRGMSPIEAIIGVVDRDCPLLPAWLDAQRSHLLRQGERATALRWELEAFINAPRHPRALVSASEGAPKRASP